MDGLNIMVGGLIGICLSGVITIMLLFIVDVDERSFVVRLFGNVSVLMLFATLFGIVLHLTGIL